jgi:predicted Zn-dependent protease
VFEVVGERLQKIDSCQVLLDLLIESDDAIEISAPVLRRVLTKVPPESEKVQKAHIVMLQSFPDDPASLEIATQFLIEQENLEGLNQILQNAHAAEASSLEFHLSMARYLIKIGDLRTASEALHKAVRVKADDPRVVELRQNWQQEYDARNNTK